MRKTSTYSRPFRRRRPGILLVILAGAAACAAPPPTLPASRPLGREIGAASPGSPGQPASPFSEPRGKLTLRDALAASLQKSPRLESFAWQVRADEARALQAGLLPNPALVVESENFAGSGGFGGYDAAETTVSLGQLVQLGGKRKKRERIALLERELSGWDYEGARLDVLTRTTRRFLALLAAQERSELANRLVRLAEQSLEATRARVRAGAASAVEEARSNVELSTLRVQLAQRNADLEAARKLLASSWGTGAPRFEGVAGDLFALRALPSLSEIEAELSQNPDLARWATENARREAALDLAKAEAIPDVTAGLGVRRFEESDDSALVFAVEVPIPLFDRNQGGRSAALAETHRARALARARHLELTRALIATHADASSGLEQATSLRDTVLPQAEAAFRGTQDGYRRGLFRYVDVLDAQRTLFEARTAYVDALERVHLASAKLERLIGAPLESLSRGTN